MFPLKDTMEFTITRSHGGAAGCNASFGDSSVRISSLEPDSPAYRAGMREDHVGWIITHLDGLEVTAEKFRVALDATRGPGRTFTIRVKRPEEATSDCEATRSLRLLAVDAGEVVTLLARGEATLHEVLVLLSRECGRRYDSVSFAIERFVVWSAAVAMSQRLDLNMRVKDLQPGTRTLMVMRKNAHGVPRPTMRLSHLQGAREPDRAASGDEHGPRACSYQPLVIYNSRTK